MRWEAAVTVRRDADGLDFSGPYVRGGCTDRNLFVVWVSVPGDGTLRLVAGSKLALGTVDPRLIEDALRPGHLLVARVQLTRTGTLKGRSITWSAEPADVVNTRKS
ncbi:MAG: monooxygenase [Actinomycetia bacterium]|nr:monooxygenase [Actinomycetes bacterium]